jgi:hypothetical protein
VRGRLRGYISGKARAGTRSRAFFICGLGYFEGAALQAKKCRVRRPGSYLILPLSWRNHLPEGNSWSHHTSLGGGSDEADQQPVAYMQCTTCLFKKQCCIADMHFARIWLAALRPCFACRSQTSEFSAKCPNFYQVSCDEIFRCGMRSRGQAKPFPASPPAMRRCSETRSLRSVGAQNVQRSALASRKSRKAVMRAVFFSSDG